MKGKKSNIVIYILLVILAVIFLAPIFIILFNSFKGKLYISDAPFKLPTAETFVGVQNYIDGLSKTGFLSAFGWSIFITFFSTIVIVLFTSMTGWYITRAKNKVSTALYFIFVFSMIVPFQMVMFTMSKVANMLSLDNPIGLIVLYLGFGAGLSIFMFSGFVKSIPIDIEEAALIDGCNPIKTFFLIVLPLLKPICITVAILNVMWIWNDYLLPFLVLETSDFKTITLEIYYVKMTAGQYVSPWETLFPSVLIAILPLIVIFLLFQKHFVKGVTAGAVKS